MPGLVSIIVPCYNEANTITQTVDQLNALRGSLDVEIILIDDGSTDGSFDKLIGLHGIIVERHQTNLGKGAAIATGAKRAMGDVIVVQDADLEYDASSIPALVEPILKGHWDVVYGSRFKGNIEGMTFSHLIGNKMLSYFTSFFFGAEVTDMMTGQKAFRAAVFRGLNLECSGFEFELEVTVQVLRKGYSIHEMPIRYSKRKFGEAKIGWSDGFKTLMKMIEYRFGF